MDNNYGICHSISHSSIEKIAKIHGNEGQKLLGNVGYPITRIKTKQTNQNTVQFLPLPKKTLIFNHNSIHVRPYNTLINSDISNKHNFDFYSSFS